MTYAMILKIDFSSNKRSTRNVKPGRGTRDTGRNKIVNRKS